MSFRLLNILYTNRMVDSVAFYEQLGLLRKDDGEVSPWWNEFTLGDASLALHWNEDKPLPEGSNPELHLQIPADQLEQVRTAMGDRLPSEIETLRGLGRFFRVTDPNGVIVQINEEVS